jgi:hypothetical protein
VKNVKTLLEDIVEILTSLALLALGTLLAVFFIVIFLIWGWPLTILLLLVMVKKLYFYPDNRRNNSAKFSQPRRYAHEPTFESSLRQESRVAASKDHMDGIDDHIPKLFN